MIAGSLSVGLGKLVGARGAPNDGTIFVDETRLAGISQHLVMPVSHTGLPFSKSVARQAGAFLRLGKVHRLRRVVAVQILHLKQQIEGVLGTQGVRVRGPQSEERRRFRGRAVGGANSGNSPWGEL